MVPRTTVRLPVVSVLGRPVSVRPVPFARAARDDDGDDDRADDGRDPGGDDRADDGWLTDRAGGVARFPDSSIGSMVCMTKRVR
jgi:hypothetical protein